MAWGRISHCRAVLLRGSVTGYTPDLAPGAAVAVRVVVRGETAAVFVDGARVVRSRRPVGPRGTAAGVKVYMGCPWHPPARRHPSKTAETP